MDDGERRAGSQGRLTASSDARPENLREPGGCGNGAGVLRNQRRGCGKKAGSSRLSKDEFFFFLTWNHKKDLKEKGSKFFYNLRKKSFLRKTPLKREKWIRFDH